MKFAESAHYSKIFELNSLHRTKVLITDMTLFMEGELRDKYDQAMLNEGRI